MPKLPDRILDNVIYLFESEDAARLGEKVGGTGFLVIVRSEKYPDQISHTYVVSNWHVVRRAPCSPVVRINRKDKTPKIVKAESSNWVFSEKLGYDIAVLPVDVDVEADQIAFVDIGGAVDKETVDSYKIGPGEDVFMVGRFVDHDGGKLNKPAVRFGNISVMPTPLLQPTHKYADSYILDMHSRGGYSGSPVWIYRLPGYDLTEPVKPMPGANVLLAGYNFLALLGIHYDQFPEPWRLVKGEASPQIVADPEGAAVRGFSGMTKVLPAWAIKEVLDLPELKAQRAVGDEEFAALHSIPMESTGESASSAASASVAQPEREIKSDNPDHKEDFMSLLSAAVKSRKTAGQT